VRANRFKLQQAVEDVNAQVAHLRADIASLNSKQAVLELARASLKQAEELAPSGVISKQELSKRQKAVQVEESDVEQALQIVNATRAGMGLTVELATSPSLDDAPANLDQKDASVQQALLELLHQLALLGYSPASWKTTPQEFIEEFHKQDPTGDLDRIYAKILDRAPAVKQAEAKLLRARRDLEQAELDLRYCRITSAVDGVVAHRNVSPGNHVAVGEVLLEVHLLLAPD
jgi:membrane fusion protein (multidrug efflux system)